MVTITLLFNALLNDPQTLVAIQEFIAQYGGTTIIIDWLNP